MIGNLFFIDLRFIHPNSPAPSPHHAPHEISAFAHVPLSLDLWHACLGHPGGDMIKHLSPAATGSTIESTAPLQQCELCVITKHP
ncbi:hypothetical protein BDR06DRAFT_881152 [Suillus hirtellus]|nr:hypothetical protein BDR06DRAFT_881152 [Suillus hirtellus]